MTRPEGVGGKGWVCADPGARGRTSINVLGPAIHACALTVRWPARCGQALRTWVSDRNVLNCPGCDRGFGFLLRKHHCRICGKVFCSRCSSMRIHTTASRRPARCCASCHDYIVTISFDSTQGAEPVQLHVNLDRGPNSLPLGFEYTIKEDEEFGGKICVVRETPPA